MEQTNLAQLALVNGRRMLPGDRRDLSDDRQDSVETLLARHIQIGLQLDRVQAVPTRLHLDQRRPRPRTPSDPHQTVGKVLLFDELLAEHRAWLDENVAAGVILASGAKSPRTGGVILARLDAARAAVLAATDPFFTNGAATHEVVEFVPTKGRLLDLLRPPAGT